MVLKTQPFVFKFEIELKFCFRFYLTFRKIGDGSAATVKLLSLVLSDATIVS